MSSVLSGGSTDLRTLRDTVGWYNIFLDSIVSSFMVVVDSNETEKVCSIKNNELCVPLPSISATDIMNLILVKQNFICQKTS